jgi:hypothetical protein
MLKILISGIIPDETSTNLEDFAVGQEAFVLVCEAYSEEYKIVKADKVALTGVMALEYLFFARPISLLGVRKRLRPCSK